MSIMDPLHFFAIACISIIVLYCCIQWTISKLCKELLCLPCTCLRKCCSCDTSDDAPLIN